MNVKMMVVHKPEECARRLGGISVAMLITLLKTHDYAYTNLKPGSKPWGRGRQFWGMTDEQIEALIRGQTKKHPKPGEAGQGTEAEKPRTVPGLAAMGWDGKDRLGKSRKKAAKR